jgi:hypothetical protein
METSADNLEVIRGIRLEREKKTTGEFIQGYL